MIWRAVFNISVLVLGGVVIYFLGEPEEFIGYAIVGPVVFILIVILKYFGRIT